jgi:hypothetical protein
MHRHVTSQRIQIWHVVFIAALVLFIMQSKPHAQPISVEAAFSDTSDSGMLIVPASGGTVTGTYTDAYTGSYTPPGCVYPIEGGWDASGRILYGYYGSRIINAAGRYKCVSNGTANVYFVPVNTAVEIDSFINAAGGIGVTVHY